MDDIINSIKKQQSVVFRSSLGKLTMNPLISK